jgi:hypothetical protein
MYKVTVDIDLDVFDAVQQQVSQSGALMSKAFQRQVTRVRQRLQPRFKAPDRLPALPFIWSDDPAKQRRARAYYYAVILRRRGRRGGRYPRTGKMVAAWKFKVDLRANEGVITLTNDAPGVEYVMGFKQVPSHRITGWPNGDELAFDASQELTNVAIDTWFVVADPFGGIPRL